MADIDYIPTGFKQTSDICLLASYSFVLGYYKKLNEGVQADVNVHDICNVYYSFFRNLLGQMAELEKVKDFLDVEHSVLPNPHLNLKNCCIYEYFIYRILHHFCQVYRNDTIRGYEHIREFDEYLRTQGNTVRSHNFIINGIDTQRNVIPNAYRTIKNHLDNGQHHLAMILYATGSGGHSVVVFKDDADNQYYFRDSNNPDIVNQASFINIEFSDQLDISEYLLFSDV